MTLRVRSDQRFSVQRGRPCPVCGGGGDQRSGSGQHCWGYLDDGGHTAICTRADHAGALTLRHTGYRHRLNGACPCGQAHRGPPAIPPGPRHARPETAQQPLPADRLDQIFRSYLSHLPLRPEHEAFYAHRGRWDLEAAHQFGYCSLPLGSRATQSVVDALTAEFGAADLSRTPGFWQTRQGIETHTALPEDDAAVIPCRDAAGRIITLIRHTTTGEAPKYRAFNATRSSYTVAGSGGDLWITEGTHKAHVASLAGGIRVLGLPGIYLHDVALAAVQELAPEHAIAALDMDRETNPAVQQQQETLTRRLARAGLPVLVATWDPAHKGLDDLLAAGHRPTITEPQGSHEPIPATAEISLVRQRRPQWYISRRSQDREFVTIGGENSDKLAILHTETDEGISHQDGGDMVRLEEGSDSKLALALERCGWHAGRVCDQDGERRKTSLSCKSGLHNGCLTRTGLRIAGSTLPDLEGEATYRGVWLEAPIDMPEHSNAWDDRYAGVLRDVASWGAHVTRRPKWRGVLLSRGVAMWLHPRESMLQLRLLFREERPHQADGIIADAEATFGALVVGEERNQSGEYPILQAMEDSSLTLLGMPQPYDQHLFSAWFWGTKHARFFQCYGLLFGAARHAEQEPPLVCDICGGPLRLVIYGPPEDYQPTPMAQGSPNKPDPVSGRQRALW